MASAIYNSTIAEEARAYSGNLGFANGVLRPAVTQHTGAYA